MTMRLLAAVAFLTLTLLPALAGAEARVLESRAVDRNQVPEGLQLESNVLCVDGYKYLFVFHPRPRGEFPFSGLTQMFEVRDGVAVPSRCP